MSFTLSRRHFLAGSSTFVVTRSSSFTFAQTSQRKLPIPPLVDATNAEPVELNIQRGEWSFFDGINTQTVGLSQNYLGPTIRTRANTELNLHYKNMLDEGVAIHGHGLHVPGEVDGGPQSEISPGGEWKPRIAIAQPASTCWYHSHTHGKSGEQVYRGLAGMTIVEDDISDEIELPKTYGVDDLPIIIQDRTFDENGQLIYSLEEAGNDGWYGDVVTINGAISPAAKVPAGKVRLRVLNGANARFYIVAFKDGRAFHKIATDGGFLEAPVEMTEMEMSPGERCEIIVDLSDGKKAELMALFEDEVDVGIVGKLLQVFSGQPDRIPALTLVVDQALPAQRAPLPKTIVSIERPSDNQIVKTRDFILSMDAPEGGHGSSHGHLEMAMSINGAVMDMNVINEEVKHGVWERWRVKSNQGEHPFHVHGCSFLIEKLAGVVPQQDQAGWKDTIVLDDDGWSEFIVKFDHTATRAFPYMYHCHILEHEDLGMMGQFTVS